MNEYSRIQIVILLTLIFLPTKIANAGTWAGETPFEIVKSKQVGGNIIWIEWKRDNTGFTFAFQKDTSGGYPGLISDIDLSSSGYTYTIKTDENSDPMNLTTFSQSDISNRFVVAYENNLLSLYGYGETSTIKDSK